MSWQPIETAPKDGTFILLWEKYSTGPIVGYWRNRFNAQNPDFGFWQISDEHAYIAEDRIDQSIITHWQPLPEPPCT